MFHRWKTGKRPLHLAGMDVIAAADVHVAAATDEDEIAVGTDGADIAGPQPTVAQHLCGEFRVAPVATHHTRAAHLDHAVGSDPYIHSRGGPPHGAELNLGDIVRFGAADGRTLGHRVPHDQRDPDALGDPPYQFGRCRSGGHHADPQLWQRLRAHSVDIEQLGPLGRHRASHSDPLVAEHVEHALRRPRCRWHHQRAAPHQLIPELEHVAGVRKRRRREAPVVGRAHHA